jgi:hypothetical protein
MTKCINYLVITIINLFGSIPLSGFEEIASGHFWQNTFPTVGVFKVLLFFYFKRNLKTVCAIYLLIVSAFQ